MMPDHCTLGQRRWLIRRWYREGYKAAKISQLMNCDQGEIQRAVMGLPLRQLKKRKKAV